MRAPITALSATVSRGRRMRLATGAPDRRAHLEQPNAGRSMCGAVTLAACVRSAPSSAPLCARCVAAIWAELTNRAAA